MEISNTINALGKRPVN